ncbi:gibberellin-regulated protein 1-like [Ipomoea triloba]|uniref:gibberellin-regulated protein 1-like n=1 Tax=Ipomoea triloba TaxID=35885 RepID=UPI00125D7A01|nr:gibberellin-regulated protein 1-like [Ipomoea triloba]
MAYSTKAVAASLLVSLLILHLSNAQFDQAELSNAPAPSPKPQGIDCPAACGERCKKSKRPNLCKRSCGSCCNTCKCVPPGTSGNYEICPCYFNLKTHNNTRKCP